METASAPHESQQPHGRLDDGAAAARTAELYTRYGRTVAGLCKALLRDRAEAEDAAQQTFLSAHRALLNGTDPREPAAWLATIARNECWARIRTRMREPLPANDLEAPSAQGDPLAESIRRADLAALWRAIEALPRQQRDALLLREFGGLTYEELAAALAVTAPAVESLLFRARSRLRTQLRAAYASLNGASVLEALARIFAGGAPVAAKVAALGVGAAAVTGGAVVTPQLLDRHQGRGRPPAPPQAPVAESPPPAIVQDAVVPALRRPPATVVARRAPAPTARHLVRLQRHRAAPELSHEGRTRSARTHDDGQIAGSALQGPEQRSGGTHREDRSSGSGDGETRQRDATVEHTSSDHDGSGGGDGVEASSGSSSGSGGDGSSGGGDGSSGGGAGEDGGSQTTDTTTTVSDHGGG